MIKDAYLIMAYSNFDFLKKLILLLDDERNDIFVHIDLKAQEFDKAVFENCTSYSNLAFIERKPVFWADYSQVDVMLDLLAAAEKAGQYHYFHFLSGMDLPLKTQDEIHAFFDSRNQEFIGMVPKESWYSVRRVRFYHPFTHMRIYRNCKPLKALDRMLEYVQRLFGVNRLKNKELKVIDGWQWCSVTQDFVSYLLKQRAFIEETFSKSLCPDELAFQTMVYNSDFRSKLYCEEDLKKGSQRFIDWNRGSPYVFRKNDFEELMKSPYMFARKFDINTDACITEKIISYLQEQK